MRKDRVMMDEVVKLKEEVAELQRSKFAAVVKQNREYRSTIDGMTEHEKDVGMVRLASTICPSNEDIQTFAFEKTIEHPDGMSKQQCQHLYSHRGEIFEYLVEYIQENDWAEHFRAACLTVLEDCAFERVKAEHGEVQYSTEEDGIADLLKHGYIRTDEEKAADLKDAQDEG